VTATAPEPPNPPAPAGPRVGETTLWMPTTSGGSARFAFARSPEWQLDAGGWYVPETVSGGACLLDWTVADRHHIPSRLRSFTELPTLLEQARALGTNVVYVVNTYQGAEGAPLVNWWKNKGDYVIRSDLGGDRAFRDGVAAVHAQGGRVVVYVEGFLISKTSSIGQKSGRAWSIATAAGPLAQPYPDAWKPCPAVEAWVAYMEGVARRLGSYGVDGIFLDSYGFQKDHMCVAPSHGHALGDKEVFNRGAVELFRRFKAAFRSARPDGIVVHEGPNVERLFEYSDGSFDNGMFSFVTRWLWDAQGKTDTLTNGWSLDHWNQIVAIGAKLLCPPQFLDPAPESSATEHFDAWLKREKDAPDPPSKHRAVYGNYQGLHQWRNGGLILGLPMPGLDDLTPRRWERAAGQSDDAPDEHDPELMTKLRERAVAIDAAIGARKLPLPSAYVKSLMAGRASLSKVIDYGATVDKVETGLPRVAAWRFTGSGGTALTCVSVADEARQVTFPKATGTWKDEVSEQTFAAHAAGLSVPVPPHRVRLLRQV
jgi:hypothetical protein